ncbi:MAG: MraY family glycosyltransferase [Verrucomicrobiota bacterium]|jgi:UDP-GlcNAc:undecaprenyl-phosphate GlcNAc-1-phosphate transferase|nr:MraY family glycosyltransferase [Verrucomicrobiota bacterium]MDP7048583.1 MraY family glycosyltransferase [Verrucomicrobiota bacterium]
MFPLGLYLLALIGGAVISATSMPLWKRWCEHVGLLDEPGHRKIHTHPVPLAGGLAVVTGLAVPITGAAAWAWVGPLPESFAHVMAHGLTKRGWQLAAILGGAVAMLALGILDDRRDLSAKWKFLAQLFIALAVAASGIRLTMFVESAAFSYAVTVLWILTVTNAVNFQDNMNGLCAGLGLIGGWCFAWHAGLEGQYLVASLALLFTGALAGFLPYNFPRGGVFLGDGGSHVVGFLLAVLAILPDFYSAASPHKWLVAAPLLVLAVPLADLVSVILIRRWLGQPVWVGDNNHFSHRLVRAGLAKPRAVLVLLLIAAAFGAVTFLK